MKNLAAKEGKREPEKPKFAVTAITIHDSARNAVATAEPETHATGELTKEQRDNERSQE